MWNNNNNNNIYIFLNWSCIFIQIFTLNWNTWFQFILKSVCISVVFGLWWSLALGCGVAEGRMWLAGDGGRCLCVSVVSSSVSWRQYYEWRGLSLSCPVAPVLSSALSVYYIVTSLVPTHCECCSALLSLHSLRRATWGKPSRHDVLLVLISRTA